MFKNIQKQQIAQNVTLHHGRRLFQMEYSGRNFGKYLAENMNVDALVPCLAKKSTTMALAMHDKGVVVVHWK